MNGAKNIVAISLNGNVGRNYLKQKQNDVMPTCSKMEIVRKNRTTATLVSIRTTARVLLMSTRILNGGVWDISHRRIVRGSEGDVMQLTLFDILPKEIPLGYIRDGEVDAFKGDVIPFSQLANYIEERVLMECPRQSATDYKVVLVKKYLTDSDKVYNWRNGTSELVGTCDRVRLSDDNKRGKANMWVSEMFCKDGRYCSDRYPRRFYTIKTEA